MSRVARGARAQALIWLAIGLALLIAGVAAIYSSTGNDLLTAYGSAPACSSFNDANAGKDCRYAGTAMVTNMSRDGGETDIFFEFPAWHTPFFEARLSATAQPTAAIHVGSQVQFELWRYRVTRLAGVDTLDNPAEGSSQGILHAIGLLLLVLSASAMFVARRTWRTDQDAPSGPTMSPVATNDALWR